MIIFLQHEKIDKKRWDDCIQNAINGNLNAFSWYLDIVSPNWCALIEDDYEKVFPLTVFSKAGFKYIMQPYFTQQLGLFYRTLSSDNKTEEFIKCIPAVYKYVDINLNTSNRISDTEHVSDFINLELDLISEYDKIASGYQGNLQRNLKKAANSKLSLTRHVRPEEIISLFRANKGQELKHLNDAQYALIQHITYECIHKGIAETWGAYDEFNQLVAGIIWVTSHQKAVFLFSALSENGKKLNAMPWLIDNFIRQNSGKPLILDFEGSNNEGLARFYGSFGSNRLKYQRYVRNFLPGPLNKALQTWRLIRLRLKNMYFMLNQ